MEGKASWLLGNTLFSQQSDQMSAVTFPQRVFPTAVDTNTHYYHTDLATTRHVSEHVTDRPGTASFWWAVVGNIRSGLTGWSRESPSRRWDGIPSAALWAFCGSVVCSSWFFCAERGLGDVGVVDGVLLSKDSPTRCG